MQFKEVHHPVSKDLNLVERELRIIGGGLSGSHLQEIIDGFFKIPGKRLRPVLALLSAGIINDQLSWSNRTRLIRFAAGLELMHSASLIHDDVIDEDLSRRGQATINKTYGNKMAVLAGDVVYSMAFSTFSITLSQESVAMIARLTEHMCAAEAIQAENALPTREVYLNIIKGKTALFMSVSCKIAARLAGATKKQSAMLEEYGLNLGMAYQIADDCLDKDIDAKLNISITDAELYGNRARAALNGFKDSPYKRSMEELISYILDLPQREMSRTE